MTQGADVDFKDKNGEAPLHKAAKGGHLDVVKALLDAGNYEDQTLMMNFMKTPCVNAHLLQTMHCSQVSHQSYSDLQSFNNFELTLILSCITTYSKVLR